MLEILALAGVCALIGLMGRDVKERVAVSLILGVFVAPIAFLLMELWNSEHSGPQMFLEAFTYFGIYWPMILGLTAALTAGSLLVGLAREYVVKEVG